MFLPTIFVLFFNIINAVSLVVNDKLVANNYQFIFNVSNIPDTYDIGEIIIGNCSDKFVLSTQTNLFNYKEHNLINDCKFNVANSNNILKYSNNIYVYGYKCAGQIINTNCKKNQLKSLLINSTMIISTSLLTEANITSTSFTIEDNFDIPQIDIKYSSILSPIGLNYSDELNSLEIFGDTKLCMRQTIFGNNETISVACNDLILKATCISDDEQLLIDLSSYPCSLYFNSDYDNDHNYFVEYCVHFKTKYFSTINTCFGKFTSKILLQSSYDSRFLTDDKQNDIIDIPFTFHNVKPKNAINYIKVCSIIVSCIIFFAFVIKSYNLRKHSKIYNSIKTDEDDIVKTVIKPKRICVKEYQNKTLLI